MGKWTTGAVTGALGLMLAACGGDGTPAGEDSEAEPMALASTAGADGAAAGQTPGPADTSGTPAAQSSDGAAAAAASAKAAPANDLTAYIGKFPFEEVGGVTWNDHPLVVAGIRKTVTDAAVRRAMQSPSGPSAPIATYQGKVGAWSCEQHNCGDHQWAVLVNPGSGATDVCYHDAEQTGENSRWFLASGREETRPGNCSVV